MSALTSAKCTECGHIGPKLAMLKVFENGFVKGYKHKNCESYKAAPEDTKDVIEDSYSRASSLFVKNRNMRKSQQF
jgi:hypothetical protein